MNIYYLCTQQRQIRISMNSPKIALVKQEVYQDLYVCPTSEKDAGNILFSSQGRVGPIALMAELGADFYIVHEEPQWETQLYRKVIPHLAKHLYLLKTQTLDKIPGQEFKRPGSAHANGDFAVSCYSVDWGAYDIVISINISLPTALVRQYPHTLFAYMIGEANMATRTARFGYDVTLNQLARGIVEYRQEHGPFASRAELKKVPRLGPAAYQQCAGFLRIPGAANPLDNTAVHPESYKIVERMAADAGCTVAELIASPEKRRGIDIRKYVTDTVGLPTLTDIMDELDKPGRDMRGQAEDFEFDPNVTSIDNLAEGMELPGIITNITNFGAFVDIGVHQDGLVHISQLSDSFVTDPTQVVRLRQHVMVRVLGVDRKRKRISLSMKGLRKHG